MRHLKRSFSFLCILLIIISCKEDNEPPILQSIIAVPATIKTGEITQLTCAATDSNGDQLTYSWSASGGLFIDENSKNTVTWKAPNVNGNYSVTVAVCDGTNMDDDSVIITVEVKQIHRMFEDPRDGKIYKTIILNDQEWMAENLAFLPKVSPPSDGSVSEPFFYVYGYKGTSIAEAKATSNYSTYGVLYNWPAAKAACPIGWHLPTDEEWKQLELSIGMSQSEINAVDKTMRGTNEGEKLKATNGWIKNGAGTDNFDFTGLPGGLRSFDGIFGFMGSHCAWWSATDDKRLDQPYVRALYYQHAEVLYHHMQKEDGISVRCVKD